MFEVKGYWDDNYYIGNGHGNYMHRDGEIVSGACEYWPTREQAQAVLDKYQPPHVWKHGDVFKNRVGVCMILVQNHDSTEERVFCLAPYCDLDHPDVDHWLRNATFLFNINDKLGDS
jgi:hypothetical protein